MKRGYLLRPGGHRPLQHHRGGCQISPDRCRARPRRSARQQVATLRFLLGAAFILVLLLGQRQGKFIAGAVRVDGLPIALLGAVGVFLTFFLLHEGIESTSASTAAVIFSMNPVFTVLIASVVLRERLGVAGWLGVGLGLVGAFIAVTGFHFSGLSPGRISWAGVLVLVSAATWSSIRCTARGIPSATAAWCCSFLTMAAGSLLLAVLLTVEGGWAEMARL